MAFDHPELSISHTQIRTFDACPRQWWIGAVGQWGGWNDELESAPAGRAYRLKKLEFARAWVGKEAHDGIAQLLTDPQRSAGAVVARLAESMRAKFARSASIGKGRFGPPKEFRLDAHFFAVTLSPQFLDESIEEVKEILESFEYFCATHPSLDFRALASDARSHRRFLKIDSPDGPIEERKFRSDKIGSGNVSVWVSPDFVVEFAPGQFLIVDWKTGNPDASKSADLTPQLSGYLAWLHSAPQNSLVEPSHVELFEFYLPECREAGRVSTARDLQNAFDELDKAAKHLLKLRGEHPRVPMEACPPHPKQARCGACLFRSVCKAGSTLLDGAGA